MTSRRILPIIFSICCIVLLPDVVYCFSRSSISRAHVTLSPTILNRQTTTTGYPFVRSESSLASTLQEDESMEPAFSARRISYLSLWVGLLGYTTYFTSTVTPEAAAVADKVLNTAIFTPFDGTLSPVFVTLFFFLGIIPTVYGSLLLPSCKKQKLWALPFVASSFALGFFGIGPYLGLRNKPDSPDSLTVEDRDTGSGLFENKVTPLFLLASAIYLVYYAINGAYEGTDRWQGYLDLFNSQPLARISTIDFTILSLAVSLSISVFVFISFSDYESWIESICSHRICTLDRITTS